MEHSQPKKQEGEFENDSLLNFQLDLIKTEITHIHEIVGRIDEITQQIKNWAILIWAGSISLIIGNSNTDLRQLIIITAVIPCLFWIVDGHFRRRQRLFLFRNRRIADYLNSEELITSFNQKRIKDFVLLDLMSRHHDKDEVQKFSNVRRTMWFKSMRTFYLGLIVITIILQIFLYPKPESKILNSNITQKNQDSLVIARQNEILNNLYLIRKDIDSLKEIK